LPSLVSPFCRFAKNSGCQHADHRFSLQLIAVVSDVLRSPNIAPVLGAFLRRAPCLASMVLDFEISSKRRSGIVA
jgi:hypothetical protein